jgi:hypothetical protein
MSCSRRFGDALRSPIGEGLEEDGAAGCDDGHEIGDSGRRGLASFRQGSRARGRTMTDVLLIPALRPPNEGTGLDCAASSRRCGALLDGCCGTPARGEALTAWGGHGRREALGMGTEAQHYLDRARYCEDMAAMTGGHRVSADFAELARQWRELASQRQDSEKSLPGSD